MVAQGKLDIIVIFISLQMRCLFPLTSCRIFSFLLICCCLKYLEAVLAFFSLAFSDFLRSVVCEILMVSNISSVPFFSFCYSNYTYAILFIVVPQILDIAFCYSQLSSPLLSGFGDFYEYIFKLSDSLLSHLLCTNKPIKGILHFCYF